MNNQNNNYKNFKILNIDNDEFKRSHVINSSSSGNIDICFDYSNKKTLMKNKSPKNNKKGKINNSKEEFISANNDIFLNQKKKKRVNYMINT